MVNRNERRANIWQKIQEYKSSFGCSECGYNKSSFALQFHHPNDDKKANVSDLIRSDYGLETIWNEIRKCIVLCANCHAIITHSKKDYQPDS